MRMIVFDTETTAPEPGAICQLAYLMIDGPRVSGRNFFFAVDEMTPRALSIHGLSPEKLNLLSGGRRFRDSAREIFADFEACDCLAGHGVALDERFIRAEFERCGLELGEKQRFCTRDFFVRMMRGKYGVRTAWPSLARLTARCDLSPALIAEAAREWFGGGEAAHDARYDAAATWLVMREMAARGELERFF